MLYKSLAALSLVGLASAFHGTGYEVEAYSDPDCLDFWGPKRCAKMSGKGYCAAADECPSSKSFRCSKTREYCAGTCGTCPDKCVVPEAVEGVYGGAFPAPGSGGALEFPFFLKFENGYGTLYMYGDKMSWLNPVAVSPEEFGCALWVNADGSAGLAWYMNYDAEGNILDPDFVAATGGDAPFCATLSAASMGVDSIDYGAYWALAEQVEGGFFFNGVEGEIDLSGGYGTESAVWTAGQNIDPSGAYVQVAAMALDVTEGGAAPYYATPDALWTMGTESVSPSFVFTEGKVCYTAPPLWNGAYPDGFAAYAGSVGQSLCLDKIA
jgi:hypothetical protein